MDSKPEETSSGVSISSKGVPNVAGSVSAVQNREGGVSFSGGRVTIHGDVTGRDKITTTTNTSGMTAEDFATAFSAIYDKIAKLPAESQPVVKSAVDTIKAAAEKEVMEGKKPDAAAVEMTAQALAFTAPDLLQDVADVALATLQSPANGVMTIIRKVLDRVKAMRGGATA